MSCSYAHDDGSYILGALSPTERHEFQEHLADCDGCARSVSAIAGLPGLLARLDSSELDPPAAAEPVRDTLLPALLEQARRHRRRRTTAIAGLAAAAAAAAAVGSLTLTGLVGRQEAPTAAPGAGIGRTSTSATGRPMLPVGAVPVRATVAFHSVAWGTRIDMTCTYTPPGGRYATTRPATYVLVVHTRDGHTQQVATWRSLPARTMRVTAATAASHSQIASVEVHTTDGRPVLRLRT